MRPWCNEGTIEKEILMSNPPKIVVLYGGVGSEREVSLQSGEAITQALSENFEVSPLIIASEALPDSVKSNTDSISIIGNKKFYKFKPTFFPEFL